MIGVITTLLFDEARRIWRFRWLAAAVAVAVFAAAAAYVMRLPNVYDAWAQVFVSKGTPLTAAAEGVSLVGDGYGSPYVVQKTLLNDQNLEAVVKLRDPAAAHLSKAAMAAAVAQLRSRIHVSPDQGDGFVEFHYIDTDPVRAQQLAQLILDQFISRNLNRSRTDLARAQKFLDEQIASYGDMLSGVQGKIVEFRRRHPEVAVLPLPPTPLEDEPPVAAAAPAATGLAAAAAARPSMAAERVNALEAKLAQLRTTYTEQYPDVIAARRQLADAIAERDAEAREAAAAGSPALPASQAPAAPAAPAQRVRRRAAVAYLPPPLPADVAAQWVDLQRQEEVLRVDYQQLIGRREATRLSQVIYGDNGSGKYQITRAPTVPILPFGPNRTLYLVAAAFMAGAAGIGAAYVRAGMKGILVAPRELEEAFQLPVVGTVSWERAWHTRRLPPPAAHKRLSSPITPAQA